MRPGWRVRSLGSVAGGPVSNRVVAGAPLLPQVFINTTYAAPTGVRRGPGGGVCTTAAEFTTALAALTPGDYIELQAGNTFQGPFTLPNLGASGPYCHIRSSALALLPAAGTRVAPADATNMPKIIAPGNGSAAIVTATAAAFYRFVGIEFTSVHAPGDQGAPGLVALGGAQTTYSDAPHDIIVDRCYLHGNDGDENLRGLIFNGARLSAVDSYLSNFKSITSDSQAIWGANGAGPFKIVDNYLEAATENIMFGGGVAPTPGLIPSDVEIRLNTFDKRLSWNPTDPSYGGVTYVVKDLLELKSTQRMLIEANTFTHHWAGGQAGHAFQIRPGTDNAWDVVQDITIRHNLINHVTAGFSVSVHPVMGSPVPVGGRFWITNNLVIDIGAYAAGGGNVGQAFGFGGNGPDVTLTHNTFINLQNPLPAAGTFDTFSGADANGSTGGYGYMTNFVQEDNIDEVGGSYVLYGSGCGFATTALNCVAPGPSSTFLNNVLVGPWPTAQGITVASMPVNNFYPADVPSVGFVDYANSIADYHNAALTSGSAYHQAASDGKDCGCVILELDAALALGPNAYA